MTARRATTGLATTLALLAVAFAPLSAQQVTLQWKYEAGSQLLYEMTTHQETALPMGQGSSASDVTQTMRWTVDEVAPNGDATITMTTEHVQMTTSGPMGATTYDSRTDESSGSPQGAMYSAMVGQSFTMVVGANGTVKSVAGMEELLQEITSEIPPEAAAMLGTGEMFNEEWLSDMMQQSVQLFPDNPVGPGDSWDNSFTRRIPMFGEVNTTVDYNLDGLEERDGRSVALISSTGNMTFGDTAGGPLAAMMQIEMGTTEITSTMVFDVDRGVTLSSTSTTGMDFNISAAGQSRTMSTSRETTLELIEYIPGG